MRIVHVTDSFLPRMGGIERQVDSLSRLQAARGDEVTIACTVASPTPDPTDERRDIRRPHGWSGTQVAYHRAAHVLDDIDLRGVDVVHAHVSVFSPLPALALRRAAREGVPAVATVHSMWTPAEGAGLRLAHRTGLLGGPAPLWTAVSSAAADVTARHLRTPVDVLPNGIDATFWHRRRHPRTATGEFHVITVMRLAGRKRPLPFVAMMAALRDRLPAGRHLRVTIIGDGPQRPTVATAVRAAGLQTCTTLEGQLSSSGIRDLFADADVYVAPARNESFGIAALEARCAGLPVIAFAGSGVGDIVTTTRAGRLVGTDTDMVDTLAELAGAPTPPPGSDGRSPFHWPAVLTRTDEIYRHAAARTHHRTAPGLPART